MRLLLGLSLVGAVWSATASAQVVGLRPGEPRWFESKTGNVAELAFDVAADQFVHLELHQWEADVAVSVLDPAGAVFRQADDADESSLIETLSWTRAPSGRYTLRVEVKSAIADGRFSVLLDRPRPSAETDAQWLRCERAFASMQRLPVSQVQRKATTIALRRLLEEWRALGDERWAALTQAQLGANYWDGDFARGLDDCLEAADYADRSGDPMAEVGLNCAASHLTSLGYVEEANQLMRELVARYEQAGLASAVRIARLNLSRQLLIAGQTTEAARHLEGVLQAAEATGDRIAQAFAHAHLGRLHRDRGEYQRALDHYSRGLAIPHAHGASPTHRAALASVQIAVGDLTAASASARRALADARRTGRDARAESAALQVLARVHLERGEVDQAIALLSSDVALCRRKGTVPSEVDALVALGRAEATRGRRLVARRHQQDALARSREKDYPVGEALALAALCALDDADGVSGDACAASLEKAQAIGYGPVALLSRYYLARAARRGGEPEAAREQLEEALRVVGAQRLDLRRTDLRQTFSATVDDIEDEYVDLLADLASRRPAGGWEVRAFEASERARARSLRDELAEARLGIRQGADPVLLQEEDALRDRLRATLARQLRGDVPVAIAPELERRVAELQASLADVAARIRVASPRYAALSQPEPPSLDAIRSALLDDDTVLLYYALGERRSFLWVVTRASLERHVLPARREIERLARRVVVSSSAVPWSGSGAALAALGRVILAPAAPRLDVSRVVVVPDGVLHYVPFAALPGPLASGPLLEQTEVVHLPSAAAGVLLAGVPPRAGTSEVAVFADPVFRLDDERVHARTATPAPAKMASLPRELTRSGRLARLPFTRREALAIQAHAGTGARIALDFDASRAAALDERMSSYRIVHFATHGLLNASRPELSGIVLSLVDREGRPENGFLTSLDTYNLRLDADLVVLSGCRTGLGRDVRGEGIVGLTRGFMYAGARGVLASLWPVDDAATAELMRAFYAGLLGPQKLSPPAALRAAQRHVRSDPRWRAPYYWAAFQLQGVWASAPRP